MNHGISCKYVNERSKSEGDFLTTTILASIGLGALYIYELLTLVYTGKIGKRSIMLVF